MSTRTEKPEDGAETFRTVTDLDNATTALNDREDNFVPVVMVDGEPQPIRQVTWDPATENMIIEI